MSLVDTASGFLARRLSRRSFVNRAALAGSAVAVAGTDYVLRPGSAYAAICNCNGSSCDCGSLCCDGYTGFCCELNGSNSCPPGTIMGGWWKVDDSSFCTVDGRPQPRYYMDCNYQCGDCGCGPSGVCSRDCSGADCGCRLGCDHRKFGCTSFRYGQCNQDIACIGQILCRVVTCTPPWLIDPTCGTTPRTDNNTRFHSAPCLEAQPGGGVQGQVVRTELVPGGGRIVGWVAAGAPTAVRIEVDGRVATTVTADLTAQAVGEAPAEDPDARWFRAVVPLLAGPRELCASLATSPPIRIGCGQVLGRGSRPFGSFDVVRATVGRVEVLGWAIDPDTTAPVEIHVYADGTFVGRGTADGRRDDVAQRYPAFGAEHGYRVVVDVPGGATSISVYAINRSLGVVNTLLGTRDVIVPTPLTPPGYDFDRIEGSS